MKETKGTIVYIGGFEMPDKNAAAHRVLNNAKILRQLGYSVVFCGVDKDHKPLTGKQKEIEGFESLPSSYPKSAKAWMKQLLDFSHNKDILEAYGDVKYVIGYNMHAIPLKKLLVYCRRHGIKVIADLTEWYENKFSFQPVKLLKYIDTAYVMQILQKKVDGMIAISPYLASFYARYVKNIIVLPPLVDIREEKWSLTCNSFDSRIQFVYSGTPGNLGSYESEKDKLYDIIECFYSIYAEMDFRYTVIGITKQQFLDANPQSCEMIKAMGEKLSFLGKLPHNESIKALNDSDYCIFIRDKSRKNMAGFPTKFVECVTSGIGIIANDISNIKKYFPDDDKSILLSDSDTESLSRAIRQVMTLDLQKLRSRRQRSSMFDYRNYSGKIEAFLNKI